VNFCEINHVNVPDTSVIPHFLSSWNVSFLDNNLREFIYKFRNNLIKTNDRLSHILSNVDQTCFLCKCLPISLKHHETFNHLFRTCPVTKNLISTVILISLTFPHLRTFIAYHMRDHIGELRS
jgi:hypothetical protein